MKKAYFISSLLFLILFLIQYTVLYAESSKPPLERSLSDSRLYLKANVPPVYLSPNTLGYREVTGYSSTVAQTDSTPFITASGQRVRENLIACPRYLPFGTVLQIDNKIYYCGDRMNERYQHRFDIWFPTEQEAINYGLQIKEIILLES